MARVRMVFGLVVLLPFTPAAAQTNLPPPELPDLEIRLWHGEIQVRGKPIQVATPKAALRHGIALVSEDRQGYGLVPTLPIRMREVCIATALVMAQVLPMNVSWGNQT